MLSPETPAPERLPERLHGLDALRGGALLLGVALHAAMSFMPGPVWIVTDSQPSRTLTVGFYAVHLFRMMIFFLIAGFFARMGLHRRGAGGFIVDRLKRIAAPLFVFWPLVMTGIIAVLIWNAARVAAGTGVSPPAPPPPAFTPTSFPLTHLWFLWVLLLFYAVLVPGRSLLAAVDRSGGLRRALDGPARLVLGWPAPLVLAVPLACALFYQPHWLPFFGIPTPDQSLIPGVPALVGYGLAFMAGYALHRQPTLLEGAAKRWLPTLLLGAAAGTSVLFLLNQLLPAILPAEDMRLKAALAGLYALAAYGLTFGLLGAGLRFMSGHSKARRYVADASYWVYIIHIPIIMAGQVLIAGLGWPWPVKYGALLGGGLAIMFLTYQLLIRHSFMGTWLNGKRSRPGPRARAALVHAE